MLEIHGDTELSNMESFNLKETNCKCSYTYRCMCWKNKAHSE